MITKWPSVRLGEVLRRSNESVMLQPDKRYREITVRLWGKGVVLRGIVTGAEVAAQRRHVAREGQFILSRIDARNGALGIVPQHLDGAIITNDFPVFQLAEDHLLPRYLGWMCRTAAFVEECRRASEGTTNRVRLQEDRFLAREISLPSLSEQQRVVARIDQLASLICEARKLRDQAAGEAEALLTSARRHAMIDSFAEGVRLESVCTDIIDNLHSNPVLSMAGNGIPCVRSPDVGFGTLNLESAQRTDEDEYLRRTARGEPQTNDLVLVREGGGTGKCAIVLPGQRFSLGQRVMMLRPNLDRINPGFFMHQMLSPIVQEDQISALSKGSASPHLNIATLRKFTLRLPALKEQVRIARELDHLQENVGEAQRLQSGSVLELEALLPSVLTNAFRGHL